MEVSTEISHKIRSAIKAKLLELGAYVDDELPDYIMVMVANKRSRTQMRSDLGLFLGNNTNNFTEWLHSLLEKLQTIRADSDKSAGKQQKADKSKLKKKEKSQNSDVSLKASNDSGEKNVSDNSENNHANASCKIGEDVQPGSLTEQHSEHTDEIDDKSRDNIVGSYKSTEEVDEDVRQLLVTEAHEDELAEELETTDVEAPTLKSSAARSLLLQKEVSTGQTINPEGPDVQSLAATRKRKVPASIVANVNRREDNDEEYDPYSPAVGSVASVVKVTARKSSLPPAMQANRKTNDVTGDSHTDDGEPAEKIIRLAETVQLEDIKLALEEVIKKTQVPNDDVAQFSRMIESTLRRFNPQNLFMAKLRIQKVLFDIESSVAQRTENIHDKLEETVQPNVISENVNTPIICSSNNVDTGSKLNDLCANNSSECISSTGVQDVTLSRTCLVFGAAASTADNSDAEINNLSEVNEHNLDHNDCEDSSDAKLECSRLEDVTDTDSVKSKLEMHPTSASHLCREIYSRKQKPNKNKSSQETDSDQSRYHNSAVKMKDKKLPVQSDKGEQSQKSSVLTSQVCEESPSSVRSCSPSSSAGVDGRQIRKSTLTPTDLHTKSAASQINRSKSSSSSTSKSVPSIFVDSLHSRKRAESSETVSVLRQGCIRDRSPRGTDLSEQDESRDSPKQFKPETLKVMAKNFKITVINEHAAKLHPGSSTEDSSSDDSEVESSDNNDDNKGGRNKKSSERAKEGTRGNHKSKTNLSTE